MGDFFKRNLVWIAILLCIAGVVLSIIGIPSGKPIFFFIGIVLSLPTVGYLIYQIFFYREKPELSLSPAGTKISTSNITSIIVNKDDVLLRDEITDEDDLEPLYNGYANENEIAKRLHELTNNERERTMIELPEINLPEIQSINNEDTTAIQIATNDELLRQREALTNASAMFSTEIPEDLIEEPIAIVNDTEILENKPQNGTIINTNANEIDEVEKEEQTATLSLDDPNFIPPEEPVMPQNIIPQKTKTVRINTANTEIRKQRAQEKKTLLSQPNLERCLRRYFVETAACFLMDRTIYKDKNGIAPYNKLAVNKETNLPEYTMSATKGRLYKFCAYLVDAERFITHQNLYNDFITAVEQGVSLSRISETLHPLYRKKYKKDFVLNLSNREDWDNVIILVYNNYILNNDNFKDIFTHLPFEVPFAYNDENIIDYLKDPDLQERFAEKYSALEEMGVPTFWEAIYICFINSIKQKLTIEQLETALLREYKKISRSLKRIDNTRRKTLRKAS